MRELIHRPEKSGKTYHVGTITMVPQRGGLQVKTTPRIYIPSENLEFLRFFLGEYHLKIWEDGTLELFIPKTIK